MGKSMPVFVITGWQVAIRPVSYTHLDVYKRQALFLPQYRAYRDRRESLARMRRVTKGMLADLVDERQARPSADPDQLESAQELELYLRVPFFVLSDAREIALRGQVERLYRRLMGPAPDLAALRRDVAAL